MPLTRLKKYRFHALAHHNVRQTDIIDLQNRLLDCNCYMTGTRQKFDNMVRKTLSIVMLAILVEHSFRASAWFHLKMENAALERKCTHRQVDRLQTQPSVRRPAAWRHATRGQENDFGGRGHDFVGWSSDFGGWSNAFGAWSNDLGRQSSDFGGGK